MRLIDADALLAAYDREHVGAPGRARKLIEEAPDAQETTRFVVDVLGCKCKKCRKMICLPGIVPNLATLKQQEWMFCPYCGRKAEWE